MKNILCITILMLSLACVDAQAQGRVTPKCKTCAKPIASCQFKGKHPKPNPTPGGKVSTKQTSGSINGHEWVDLGLSVKWATCNVGASKPEDYGGYYSQGETWRKDVYNETSYISPSVSNTSDGRFYLDAASDAASANWGAPWRMPTDEENKELCKKCKWTWTAQNGHNGYRVTGPSGKSIFLPASGGFGREQIEGLGIKGYYWTRDCGWSNKKNCYNGRTLEFDNTEYYTDNAKSWAGLCVRPVTK